MPTSSNPDHLTHPKYRPDIDGLRAIAILAVVGFHAFPNWVHGGFIGVDIFFVISGFLISTIIVGSLERNSFSFVEFYIRRINRIFPALLLVLIACFAFGWFALLADEYKQLGKHIAGGAGFISNFLFWNESGYFDNAAETKPLLHLWSLGIEEQFYIAWPLMLWFAWKQRWSLLTVTIVVVLISFALNLHKVSGDAVAAFYSPQTRFWELLVGSALAYVTLHKQKQLSMLKPIDAWFGKWLGRLIYAHPLAANGNKLRHLQSLLGAVLITVGFFYITKARAFPGWWAVLPTVGTLLIIAAGKQAWLNRVVLSNRVLVWFGLISFPLYLWHWPLLSFARIVEGGTPSAEIRIAAVLISIVLAWLTYRLIEKPIRFGNHGQVKTITLLVLMLVVGFVGYISYQRDGLGFRFSKENLISNEDKVLSNFHLNSGADRIDQHCKKFIGGSDREAIHGNENIYCQIISSAPRLLIIGDSHAIAFAYSQVDVGNKDIAVVAANGCLPLLHFVSIHKTDEFDNQVKVCQGSIKAALIIAKAFPSIEHIVLVGRGPLYLSGHGFGVEGSEVVYSLKEISGKSLTNSEAFVRGYLETINEFIKLNKKVIFTLDVPELGIFPQNCFESRPFRITHRHISECAISLSSLKERQLLYRSLVREIIAKSKLVEVFDPQSVFCDNEKCYGKNANKIYYHDDDHLSKVGSALVFDAFNSWLSEKRINKPKPLHMPFPS